MTKSRFYLIFVRLFDLSLMKMSKRYTWGMPLFFLVICAACQSPTQNDQNNFLKEQQLALLQMEDGFAYLIDSQKIAQPALHLSAHVVQSLITVLPETTGQFDSTRLQESQALYQDAAMLVQVSSLERTTDSLAKYTSRYGLSIKKEQLTETDFYKKHILSFEGKPEVLHQVLADIKNDAQYLRRKDVWEQPENTLGEQLQFAILSKQATLESLPALLEQEVQNINKLQLKQAENSIKAQLGNLQNQASQLVQVNPVSRIALTCYEIKANPTIDAQSANFGKTFKDNLVIGWAQFKVFLLDIAFLWPFILIGLIFFLTAIFAVRSSKKKSRDFRLQTLEIQRQMMQSKQNNI